MTPDEIADVLKDDILAGRIPPSADLRQTLLANRFGVSRIPIRDALRLLAADGLAIIDPGRGAVVVSLSATELAEIYDLRILLECDCLRRAAERIDEPVWAGIDRVRRKAELDASTPDWSDGDWAFHEALYGMAGRPRQLTLIRNLRQTCRVAAAGYHTMPEAQSRWLSDHSDITERLQAGDHEGAVEALRRHLEGARDHLLARMR